MISKEKLINNILQHEQVLSDANYIFRNGYMKRQNEIIDIINNQPTVNAGDIDDAYLQLVKENIELKKKLTAGKWIPVEQGLPECKEETYGGRYASDSVNVTIRSKDGKLYTSVDFMFDDGTWACVFLGETVIAWAPLPEPYDPESKDTDNCSETERTGMTCITAAKSAVNTEIAQGVKEATDPCHGCFGASNNDCQGCRKSAMLDTFLGSRKGE